MAQVGIDIVITHQEVVPSAPDPPAPFKTNAATWTELWACHVTDHPVFRFYVYQMLLPEMEGESTHTCVWGVPR